MTPRSFWNARSGDCESLDPKSMTIPDQSLSVRDILNRYTLGQMELPPIDVGDDEDFDTPVMSDFDDLVDAHDLSSQIPDFIDTLRKSSESSPASSDEVSPSSDTSLPTD